MNPKISTRLAAVAVVALLATPMTPAFAQTFANPAELSAKSHTLKIVMQMSDADRTVPDGGTKHLRYFQGWQFDDPATKAPATVTAFTPGPTLRARVGDKVEILFLNTVDDANFPYTFVTAEGKTNPAYGCDGTANLAVYPAKDRYPNCFHGSSTANLHFHGTHVTPNALGDNVLIQVMPDKTATQALWQKTIQQIFDRATPAANWAELPSDYTTRQQALVKAKDEHLWMSNEQQIKLGQFPQYISGAFANYFEIPDFDSGKYVAGQAPGTQWYHAHKHGSTALHTLNGLAGMFIIEGKYDDFLRAKYGLGSTYAGSTFEKLFVLQYINPDLDLERTRANGPTTLLVNGAKQPTLKMKPGEIQLWRVLNATVGSGGNGTIGASVFQGKDFQFVQTAQDGVQFNKANLVAQPNVNGAGITLAGGNRVDVLVRAPKTPGTTAFKNTNGTVVFNVEVTNDPPVTMTFPCEGDDPAHPDPNCWADFPKFLDDLVPAKDYPHHVAFGWDAEPGRTAAGRVTSPVGNNLPPKFTIDNKQFEEFGPLIDQCMPLEATQDWVLENNTTLAHPYHIHINPFQVVKIETPVKSQDGNSVTYTTTAPTGNLIWQDVVAIPAAVQLTNGLLAQGRVTIRQHYADFTGTFVLHCHILAHEDRGMMQLVRIVPADKFPGDCQQAIPHHH